MTDHQDLHAPFENEDEVDGLDLTPRQAPPVGGGDATRGRRIAVIGVLAVLAVALIFMAYQSLSTASVFFRNADEAVAERDSLGDRRFRLQGRVVDGSVESDGSTVRFTVTHGESDRILVAHEEEYEAEHPDRTDDYVGEGSAEQ